MAELHLLVHRNENKLYEWPPCDITQWSNGITKLSEWCRESSEHYACILYMHEILSQKRSYGTIADIRRRPMPSYALGAIRVHRLRRPAPLPAAALLRSSERRACTALFVSFCDMHICFICKYCGREHKMQYCNYLHIPWLKTRDNGWLWSFLKLFLFLTRMNRNSDMNPGENGMK